MALARGAARLASPVRLSPADQDKQLLPVAGLLAREWRARGVRHGARASYRRAMPAFSAA